MFKSNKRKKTKPLGSRRKPQAEDDDDEGDGPVGAEPGRGAGDEGMDGPPFVSPLQWTKLRQKQRTSAATTSVLREGTIAASAATTAETLPFNGPQNETTGRISSNHSAPTRTPKATSRRKRPKVGFGGGITTTTTTTTIDETTTAREEANRMYSKESLARLKAEQQLLQPIPQPPAPTTTTIQPAAGQANEPSVQQMLETSEPDDFISHLNNPLLSAEEETQDYEQTILAGDEALAYYETEDVVGEENDQTNDNTKASGAMMDQNTLLLPIEEDRTEADDDWQDQLSRRAQWGVTPIIGTNNDSPPKQQLQPDIPNNNRNDTNSSKSPSSSLSQFQQYVAKTLATLQVQQGQVQDQISRRHDQLAETITTIQHHETTVHAVGSALEFYQHWRIRLCEFITTLRSLQTIFHTNIRPASQSWHQDVANGAVWTVTWQDDVAHSLQEAGALYQVLGRPVPVGNLVEEQTTNKTDEFGRIVQSQQTLQREKRTARRDRIQDQYRKRHWPKTDTLILGEHIDLNTTMDTMILRGDESDALWSENEEESLRTRHSALKEAIAFALESVDHPHCTVLQNLFDLFQEWYDAHPEEYNQCYAALSLADLASVLITSEIILLNDPWDESSGYNEMKWTAVVHSALKHNYIDEAAVDRLVEKTAIPILKDLFDVKGINLISRRQVGSVGTFIKHMLNILPKGKRIRQLESSARLLDMVTQFTVDALGSIAVPVTTAPTGASTALSQPMSVAQRAMYDASWGQLRRMRKIITNLVKLWGPLMATNITFATAILDFISNRFLFVLSSMGKVVGDGLRESKVDDLAAIYLSIKDTTSWLEEPALMLASAPIAAAALAYKIVQEK